MAAFWVGSSADRISSASGLLRAKGDRYQLKDLRLCKHSHPFHWFHEYVMEVSLLFISRGHAIHCLIRV